MVRRSCQPAATTTKILECRYRACISCGGRMWHDYDNSRRVRPLKGVVQLHLKIRRCPDPQCERFGLPYRPEAEGQWALPQHEFGLDVIAFVGALRHQEHRSVPEIHQHLQQRQVQVSERTVSNLLARYDELLAVKLGDSGRIAAIVTKQQRVILALDGLQPDVGHEVLWVGQGLLER